MLEGKSEYTLALYKHFIDVYRKIGEITIRPTKTMIAIGGGKKAVYITRLGKDFMDVTFPFDQPYNDNLCFTKIAQVPGTNQYNHHFRMMSKDDLNAEVKKYMKLAINH